MSNPRRFVYALVSVAAAISLAAFTGPTDTANAGEMGTMGIPFTTIAGGQLSGFGNYCGLPMDPPPAAPGGPPCVAAVAEPGLEAVIRDACAWESLWNEHASFLLPAPPAPVVDFEKFVVIAVVAGPRPNGCYGVAVTEITQQGAVRTVHVGEGVPCADSHCTMIVTNPFHFVRVPKRPLPPKAPVCFEHRYME